MKDYKMLAVYYLKHNKKRSIITILGVAIAVLVLFVLLNIALDFFLDKREETRQQADYDFVLYAETESQIQEIIGREDVKSAYVGQAYDEAADKLYENALYVNITNPYKMSETLKAMEEEYGIAGEMNMELAMYYFNDGDDNMIFILVMFVLLVAYIFAIFGVGIIRNSIQLFSIEQIKDYGILRCIGATKGQLRTFVYMMGAILEITGVIAGVILGYPVSAIIGAVLHNAVSFHFLPVALILFVFLGDLFFVMQESCKFVNNMTPISAVRGEFRIKKEKLKVRGKGIMGRLLGVEGEYAYKSLMRNPGRFWKSVFAIGIGVAAFIAMMSGTTLANSMLRDGKKRFGKYQIYFYNDVSVYSDAEDVAAGLPTMDMFEKIAEEDCITEVKRIYLSQIYATDPDQVVGRYTKEYSSKAMAGRGNKQIYDSYKKGKQNWEILASAISLVGYDEEDFKDLESYLVAGTIDVSDQGVVLVGAKEAENMSSDDETLIEPITYSHYSITDHKVGDTIDIVDTKKLMERVKEWKEMAEKEQEDNADNQSWEYDALTEAVTKIRQELIDAGEYKTYTIEGIVDIPEEGYSGNIEMIVPLTNYFAITGLDETEVSGMKFHMEGTRISSQGLRWLEEAMWECEAISSLYVGILYIFVTLRNIIFYVALAVLFVVTLSGVNIVNTTASNLYLRRKEFAQLRVIGLSKKRLIYTVMLEGIVTTIGANIVGIVIGLGISYYIHSICRYVFATEFVIPWLAILIGFIASALLLCGAVYVPLSSLPMDMAQDLSTDGD